MREEFEAYCKELFGLIEKKEIEVRVHKTYPLEDAKQAHIVSGSRTWAQNDANRNRISSRAGQPGSCCTRSQTSRE